MDKKHTTTNQHKNLFHFLHFAFLKFIHLHVTLSDPLSSKAASSQSPSFCVNACPPKPNQEDTALITTCPPLSPHPMRLRKGVKKADAVAAFLVSSLKSECECCGPDCADGSPHSMPPVQLPQVPVTSVLIAGFPQLP